MRTIATLATRALALQARGGGFVPRIEVCLVFNRETFERDRSGAVVQVDELEHVVFEASPEDLLRLAEDFRELAEQAQHLLPVTAAETTQEGDAAP